MSLLPRLFIALSWASAILILVATPMGDCAGDKISLYDKAGHMFLFGVFAWLIFRIFAWQKGYDLKLAIIFSSVISFTYAIFGELIQAYVPGRTVSNWDLAAGAAGILLVQAFAYKKLKSKKGINLI